MSEIAIKVENISKKFIIMAGRNDSLRAALANRWSLLLGRSDKVHEEFWALKNISFTVNEGEAIGIIGENGAGKTTLLKILSRITDPTKGRIEITGKVSSLLEVGTGFHPELTGRENIYLNGTILGMKRSEVKKKFDEIVEFSGVQKFINTPVKHYSSGMYVRLAFAVAAHLDPEILIIDEVLAVGDAEFQKKCLGKMEDVTKEGRTVLFVSHNMEAVRNLCTSAMLLKKGEVIERGNVTNVVNKYLNFGGETLINQNWENLSKAPGNEHVRMHSINIRPLNKTNIITVDTGVNIDFIFYNYKSNLNLGFTLYLTNNQGTLLFESGVVITKNKDSKAGFYKVNAQIPPHLLNSGRYTARIVFGESQRYILCSLNNIFNFEVVHTSTGRDNNFSEAPGVVRPLLKWNKEFMDKSI